MSLGMQSRKRDPSEVKLRVSTNFTAANTPRVTKTPMRVASREKAHVTMFKTPEGPPEFVVRTLSTLSQQAQQSRKKRPSSVLKKKQTPQPQKVVQQLQDNQYQQRQSQSMFHSPTKKSNPGLSIQLPEGTRPHITKMGMHLPLLVPMKQVPVPTQMHVQHNRERVEWIKGFLSNVTEVSHRAGDFTLEEKIERLQRRLGGKPLPLEEHLQRIDQGQANERLEKMKKDLENQRQGINEAPRMNLQDPELLRRYQEEQDKVARARRAAEEKIKKEKDDAIFKQKLEEEKQKTEELLKRQAEERKKAREKQEEREKKEAENRAKVMQDVQDRINKAINKPQNAEDDPFSMLKKKPKKKVENEDGSPKAKKDTEGSDGGSGRKKTKKGKKKGPTVPGGALNFTSSNKNLELKDDGTVPQALVKENNEAVDLLKQADDKLKQVLEFYVPSRKNSSNKSKASSRRSKTSVRSVPAPKIIQPIPTQQPPPAQPSQHSNPVQSQHHSEKGSKQSSRGAPALSQKSKTNNVAESVVEEQAYTEQQDPGEAPANEESFNDYMAAEEEVNESNQQEEEEEEEEQ